MYCLRPLRMLAFFSCKTHPQLSLPAQARFRSIDGRVAQRHRLKRDRLLLPSLRDPVQRQCHVARGLRDTARLLSFLFEPAQQFRAAWVLETGFPGMSGRCRDVAVATLSRTLFIAECG